MDTPAMYPVPVPEILKLLIIFTVTVQRPFISFSPTHEEEPVLAAQPETLEDPLFKSSFTHACAPLGIELNAAREHT